MTVTAVFFIVSGLLTVYFGVVVLRNDYGFPNSLICSHAQAKQKALRVYVTVLVLVGMVNIAVGVHSLTDDAEDRAAAPSPASGARTDLTVMGVRDAADGRQR